MEPMSFPVVADTDTQVEVGWEPTSVVAPSSCESGHPVGWLDTESDCWMVYEMMLDTEMSPIVSVRSAAVPAFLVTKSDVFSLAVLAGGGGGRCCECLSCRLLGANFQRIMMLPWSQRSM